eukprot:TRINITY_DN8178_c0_g1_i2.p1 TRINITY_DN8178_c0_g1~~TRINITY_DN8178_c0_g1_i2.p1  ORF type:complete len:377 (+),score=120.28 TRINITY_DN8178_c0_g1_i2:75-1205(+)
MAVPDRRMYHHPIPHGRGGVRKQVGTPASQPSSAPSMATATPAAAAQRAAPPGGPSTPGVHPLMQATAGASPPKQPLGRIGRDINLTKRMLQHATRLALAKNEQQMEVEKRNLTEVEHAIQEKRMADQSLAAEAAAACPEEFINRERGWWDAEIAGWQDKREKMRHELERSALEKILATQTPEQLQELQDPRQATQWLQLMEASLHPFLNELDRTLTPLPAATAVPAKPAHIKRVPQPPEWQPIETRSGLWNTVPKTTKRFVETRDRTLNRADWSEKFSLGEVGAIGEAEDRFWNPNKSGGGDGARHTQKKMSHSHHRDPMPSAKRLGSAITTPASFDDSRQSAARPAWNDSVITTTTPTTTTATPGGGGHHRWPR